MDVKFILYVVITITTYIDTFARRKLGSVVVEVLESFSVVKVGPIKITPEGEFQETWYSRLPLRLWESFHSPALKEWQVNSVNSPPHTAYPDWVCLCRPGAGMSIRKEQLWPPGSIISDLVWTSSSSFRPPVTNNAANYSLRHDMEVMQYGV